MRPPLTAYLRYCCSEMGHGYSACHTSRKCPKTHVASPLHDFFLPRRLRRRDGAFHGAQTGGLGAGQRLWIITVSLNWLKSPGVEVLLLPVLTRVSLVLALLRNKGAQKSPGMPSQEGQTYSRCPAAGLSRPSNLTHIQGPPCPPTAKNTRQRRC